MTPSPAAPVHQVSVCWDLAHYLPHIHARYQGDEAAISLEDGNISDGKLPPKQLKMVLAWIEIHKEELFGVIGGVIGVRFQLTVAHQQTSRMADFKFSLAALLEHPQGLFDPNQPIAVRFIGF